jgi:hypothetical protein
MLAVHEQEKEGWLSRKKKEKAVDTGSERGGRSSWSHPPVIHN